MAEAQLLARAGSMSSLSESSTGDMECPVEECQHSAASAMSLMKHWDRVHEPAGRQYLCPYHVDNHCPYHSANVSNLKRHLLVVHQDTVADKRQAAAMVAKGKLYYGQFDNPKYQAPGFAAAPMPLEQYYERASLTKPVPQVALIQEAIDTEPADELSVQQVVTVETTQAAPVNDSPASQATPRTTQSASAGVVPATLAGTSEPTNDLMDEDEAGAVGGEPQLPADKDNSNTVDTHLVANLTAVPVEASIPVQILTQDIVQQMPYLVEPLFSSEDCLAQLQAWGAMHQLACMAERKRDHSPSKEQTNQKVARLETALRDSREQALQLRAKLSAVHEIFQRDPAK